TTSLTRPSAYRSPAAEPSASSGQGRRSIRQRSPSLGSYSRKLADSSSGWTASTGSVMTCGRVRSPTLLPDLAQLVRSGGVVDAAEGRGGRGRGCGGDVT